MQQWGQQGSQVIVLFIVASIIGPEALGVLAFANLFMMLAQMVINQGYAESLIQSKELSNRQTNTVFWRMMMIAAGIFIVYAAAGGVLAWQEIKGDFGWVLLALAPAVFFRPTVHMQSSLAGRDMQFKQVAKISVLSSFLGDIAAVILATQGWGVWSLVASQHIKNVLMVILIRNVTSWRLAMEFDRDSIRHVESFSSKLFGTNLMAFVAMRADQFIIGSVLGFEALGVYSLAMRLMLMIEQLLMSALNRVFFSVFSRLQEEKERMLELFYAMQNILCAAMFPALAGIAIVGPTLFTNLLGEEWAKSGTILWPLAIFMMIKTASYLFYPLQLGMGRSDLLMRSTSWACFFTLVFTLLTVWFGVVAVAAGVAMRTLCSAFVHLYYVNKSTDFNNRQFFVTVATNSGNVLLMTLVLYAIQTYTSLHWIPLSLVLAAVGVVVYSLLLRFLYRSQLTENYLKLKNCTLTTNKSATYAEVMS